MNQVPCAKCEKPVDFVIDQPRMINLPTVSMVVIEHAGKTVCPHCLSELVLAAAALQGIAFKSLAVPPQQQSNIIVPPGAGFVKPS
ncbi:MAG: hypothetical protein KGL39_22215 [Patescibacteria group bacterium]|nr:hypothetical protein [Patescibacteria group bacterium]